jgi:nucleotide-binding universal stress UspA family protein
MGDQQASARPSVPHQAGIAQHVLVAVDLPVPCEPVFDYVIPLAALLRARVTLLHVVQLPSLGMPGFKPGVTAYLDELEAERRSLLQGYTARLRRAGLPCQEAMARGLPAEQILGVAAAQHADLIVLGSRRHSGLHRLLMGSVVEKVVRLAPCPVLIVPDRPLAPQASQLRQRHGSLPRPALAPGGP